jgi:hypothetical protein
MAGMMLTTAVSRRKKSVPFQAPWFLLTSLMAAGKNKN